NRKIYDNIKLEIAIPHPNQTSGWKPHEISRYNSILNKADIITMVSQHYTKWCMQKRNKYMVDCSDTIIAVWNEQKAGGTWNTIRYAKSQNKDIRYLLLNNLL
ncbi:MAG: DUF1273 family protein, partial [Oscillospiraceae bacterium]|nr:DUF1273 family protein [Oscillospiraceae bacterium]